MMYGPYDHSWMFGDGMGMLFGVLWMLLIWGIPFLVLVALLKYLFTKTRAGVGRDDRAEKRTPLDILKESYARGEISREEFLQKRDDILEK